MKKFLVALLVLALVAPAMAVTLSGTDLGAGKMRISYNVPTGEVLRGVALKLSTTPGTATIAGTSSVTAIDSFFDVFVDYAFSVPAGFTVDPRVGHPLADPAAAGVLTSFPASTYSLCMGVLDEAGNQAGVTGTGVLCEIQYAITGASATIKVEADTLRGGAVVGDAVTQPATLNVVLNNGFTLTTSSTTGGDVTTPGEGVYPGLTGSQTLLATPAVGYAFVNWTGQVANVANVNAASTTINMIADAAIVANFALLPETVSTPTIPTVPGSKFYHTQALPASTGGSVSSYADPVQYQFDWGDGTFSAWGTGVKISKSYALAAGTSVTIKAKARCATHTAVESAWSAGLTFTIGSECQKFNLTRRINGATDNSLTSADITVLITYVNANRTNSAAFATASTHPNYDARYNFDTTASITSADISAIITYVNAARTNSAAFARTCPNNP